MKICIVSLNIVPYYKAAGASHYGGAEVQAAVLAEALSRRGNEVVFVAADLAPGESLPLPAENAFNSGDGVRGLRFFHPRMTGIMDALRRVDASVYYQRNAGMITGLTAWFCKRHGRIFVYGAGSNTDFSSRQVRIDNVRDRLLYFWGLRHADGIIVQNEGQAKSCREVLNREAIVIPNSIEPQNSGRPRQAETIVWIGALRRVKRPEIFLEMVRRLPQYSFVLIGGGIGSEPDFAENILREAGTMPNVTATGRVSHEQVDGYLESAALLVNTSSVEGFPNAFLEAWRGGVPVLSFVDVDDLISQNGAGEVCSDTDHLITRVDTLMKNGPKRATMGQNGVALIKQRFSADTMAGMYVDYFERLADAGKKAKP